MSSFIACGNGVLSRTAANSSARFAHLLAVAGIATQHEILLVPAHRQQGRHDPRLVERLQLLLDRMRGGPQGPFQARPLVEAQRAADLDEAGKGLHVLPETAAQKRGLRADRTAAERIDAALEAVDVGRNGLAQFAVPADILLVGAQQEVFLGLPGFQHRVHHLVGAGRDRGGFGGRAAMSFLRRESHQIDRAHQTEAGNSDRADGDDLMPQGNAPTATTHRKPPRNAVGDAAFMRPIW